MHGLNGMEHYSGKDAKWVRTGLRAIGSLNNAATREFVVGGIHFHLRKKDAGRIKATLRWFKQIRRSRPSGNETPFILTNHERRCIVIAVARQMRIEHMNERLLQTTSGKGAQSHAKI